MTEATTTADPMLAKIRKLLAKAEDPATTPAEAELYTAKAAQLIADYGIDEALLAHHDPSRDPVGDRVVVLDAPYAADKADLLGTLAAELRCRAVRRTRHTHGTRELSLHLFGHESDLQRVELLFTSLLLQTAHGLARTPVPPSEHKAAFRRSWMAGFTSAIGQRLRAAEREAEAQAADRFRSSGTTAALVLADRSALVNAALHEEYPNLRTARARQLSGSGGRHGWAAGQRADLGGTRIGERTVRALR
jgi:hypothetical protein